jgi:endonuclease YncB( thermonuclease family)
MAEDFDKEAVALRHDEIIREAQRIRDGLTRDVIDYYYNYYPDSEEEERKQKRGMREYLVVAVERINDLLRKL